MPNLIDALESGARRWFCVQMGVSSTFGGVLAGGAGSAAGLAVEVAQRAYAMVCDRQAPEPEEPGFTGGQCQGVSYSVVIDWKVNWYDAEIGIDRELDEATGKVVVGAVGACGMRKVGTYGLQLFWTGATGEQTESIFSDHPRFQNQVNEVQNITVTRLDGLPDSCGNAPPAYPPYIPGSNTAPGNSISWTDSENNTYNDSVDITFGFPAIEPNGSINIPVSFNFDVRPELNIEGTLNLPDFNLSLNLGGNPGLGGSECSPSSDDYIVDDGNDNYTNPPGDIPPPDATPGSPERRRILRGCLVSTTTIPPHVGQIHQDFNPDIRIPNLGYVNFLVKVGDYQGWSEDIPVKNNKQLIRCPWEGGALLVRATPRQGVVWNVRNVYTRQTFDPRFPPEPG